MFKNKRGLVRSGWKIAAVIGVFVAALFIVVGLFEMAATIVIMLADGGGIGQITNKLMALTKQLTWVLGSVQNVVCIVVVLFAWTKIMKKKREELGFGRLIQHRKELICGLILGIAAMTVAFAVLVVSGNATVVSWTPKFTADTWQYLVLFLFVGFGEEILFRGFVMSTLRQTRSIAVVLIVSSVVFSLAHFFNPNFGVVPFVNILLAGVLFGYMYIKSGNIWMAIGYHITWNYFQGNVFGFGVSGTTTTGIITTQVTEVNILNGGGFGPEGGLIATAVILLSCLFVKWYYRKKDYQFIAAETQTLNAVMDGQVIEQA